MPISPFCTNLLHLRMRNQYIILYLYRQKYQNVLRVNKASTDYNECFFSCCSWQGQRENKTQGNIHNTNEARLIEERMTMRAFTKYFWYSAMGSFTLKLLLFMFKLRFEFDKFRYLWLRFGWDSNLGACKPKGIASNRYITAGIGFNFLFDSSSMFLLVSKCLKNV